jgi:hypothetical protein
MRLEEKLLEEPRGVRTVPFRRARVGHRLDDLILGGEHGGAAFRLGAHGPKCIAPPQPLIGCRPATLLNVP